jgi:hypothetical protein
MKRVLFVGLCLVIALQVTDLVRRMRTPLPWVASNEETGQSNGGRGGMAVPPPPGRPDQPPPGVPAPPAPGQPRQPAPGGVDSIDRVPPNELIAGLLSLQQSGGPLALSDAQRQRIRPVIDELAGPVARPNETVHDAVRGAAVLLRSDQVAYILAHRAEPAPLDVTSNSGPVGPAQVSQQLVELLKTRAAEGGASEKAAAPAPNADQVGPGDLVNGLLKLEKDPSLRVTPAQARVLLEPITQLATQDERLPAGTGKIVAVLTTEQRDFILRQHDSYMAQAADSHVTQEQKLAELRQQLQ